MRRHRKKRQQKSAVPLNFVMMHGGDRLVLRTKQKIEECAEGYKVTVKLPDALIVNGKADESFQCAMFQKNDGTLYTDVDDSNGELEKAGAPICNGDEVIDDLPEILVGELALGCLVKEAGAPISYEHGTISLVIGPMSRKQKPFNILLSRRQAELISQELQQGLKRFEEVH